MIKWFFSWKLLRQLFIIWLISCFTLLVGSSVSAYSCNFNKQNFYCGGWISFWQVVNGSNLTWWSVSDNRFNFINGGKSEFDFITTDWVVLSYKWSSNNIQFNTKWDSSTTWNSWIINWYYSCTNSPWNSYYPLSDKPNCSYHEWFDWLRNSITNSTSYWFACNRWIPNYQDKYINCVVCVCSDSSCSVNKSFYCIDTSVSSPVPDDNVWNSFVPSTWSRLWGRLITNSWYTNNQMVEAYQCVWLTPELCYWWFPINDIFQPSETFEDFTWYVAWQGATIFDLYSLYPSYSNIDQFLSTYLLRFQHWWTFKNEPKALYMLFAQINTAWLKTSYISTYCDLLLNKNNNSSYTWTSIDDLRAQSCYRSQRINDSLKNSDWSNTIWQGSNVWIFWSWDDVDFDPETFFSNMMEKISSWLDKVSVWTALGVIPGYIILFTLALIFIRMISH